MRRNKPSSIASLLGLLTDMERSLAASTRQPANRAPLTRIADRAAEVNRRLHGATAAEWKAFTTEVLRRKESDATRTFLFGDYSCSIDSPQFARLLQQVVVDFAESQAGVKK